jgi:hypothetical protein
VRIAALAICCAAKHKSLRVGGREGTGGRERGGGGGGMGMRIGADADEPGCLMRVDTNVGIPYWAMSYKSYK